MGERYAGKAIVSNDLAERFDAVVMLTWSDWRTEPRSNRFHYATRFSRRLPVLFVQARDDVFSYEFEPSGHANITLLNLPGWLATRRGEAGQIRYLGRALRERQIVRPLLWVYNTNLHPFVLRAYAGLKVFHATEDYFGDRLICSPSRDLDNTIRRTLGSCDLLVAVSEGVADNYHRHTGFCGRYETVCNGCDYAFFAEGRLAPAPERPVALYQGALNYRIDFKMLRHVAEMLPSWDFVFLGRRGFVARFPEAQQAWVELLKLPNVRYVGEVTPEELRAAMYTATAGMIPFADVGSARERSFPLKAFEYVACGLPVVSVPVLELAPWEGELFTFADNAESFANALRAASARRDDPVEIQQRDRAARAQSYDLRFDRVCRALLETPICSAGPKEPLDVLVLYDTNSLHVKTTEHHLRSFAQFSGNRYHYVPATSGAICRHDLTLFDVVIIHYSVRICFPGHLAPSWERAIREYPGLKVLFIQDVYDQTNRARDAIADLGVQLVYVCLPDEAIAQVFPANHFRQVAFRQTLPGFVPLDVPARCLRPLKARQNLIGYRGRDIGWWYGHLAHDKAEIGRRMKTVCEEEAVSHDIAWDTASRVYGDAWFEFLGNCRATLGTESGSNVFDVDGQLKRQVEDELRTNPRVTYEEVHAKYLAEAEGKVVQNQLSPKLFEAAACRTALVLLEGGYSGVVTPWVHYLPLRTDYGNAHEIVRLLQDERCVEELTERAYQDLITSDRYSYRAFIQDFDEDLRRRLGRGVVTIRAHEGAEASCGQMLPPPPKSFLRRWTTQDMISRVKSALRGSRPGRAAWQVLRLAKRSVLALPRLSTPLAWFKKYLRGARGSGIVEGDLVQKNILQ
jgi:glycosyltransferase involved in cell wall biosynthesis